MAEIVNFRRARRARARSDARQAADENAARFGRTKAERRLEEARAVKDEARLDGHRLEPEDPDPDPDADPDPDPDPDGTP
ncbi:DUF4169 family protein [Pseudoroseicyclus sp. CXY001]|uniref:DUF4169 family protein n=1 Tax=Pseudoroseicyclus sp. CXY001 TaxID=3242492 RepID=UPI003570E6E0